MATATEVSERIDRTILYLSAELDDLPNVVAEWDALPGWNRAPVAIDWDNMLAGMLPELDRYACSGELSSKQHEQYRELRRKLREALPLIERLDFHRPTVALQD